MNTPSIERVNVNFPSPVLEDLRRLVPRSRRSEVIARATARELRRLNLAALFEELEKNALWTSEDHPVLADGAAVDAAIAQIRAAGAINKASATPPPLPRRKGRRE